MSHRPDEHMAGTMGPADSIHWFATGRPRPGSVALCDHLARVEMDLDR